MLPLLLEILTIATIVIPTILVIYLCLIAQKREESNKIIHYVGSFTLYVLLITMVDKTLAQLFITGLYSSILYFLFKKELEKIKQEQQNAILDEMESSYQKYAVKPRRKKTSNSTRSQEN